MKTFAQIDYRPQYEHCHTPFQVILRDVLLEEVKPENIHYFTNYDSARYFATTNAREINYDFADRIPKTTLNTITADVRDLASIECINDDVSMDASIRFVDQDGNEYEYDGVCFSEGLKVSITKVK